MNAEELGAALKPKEKRFAHEYLKDFNGTQAAIRAGYKAGTDNASAAHRASALLHEERVRVYVDALLRESAESQETSRESVILRTLEIYRRCIQAEPVLRWDSEAHEWVESGEWRFDARGAAKALEMLSKLLGYDAPVKVEHGGETIESFLKALGEGRTY